MAVDEAHTHTDAELRRAFFVRPRKAGKLYATCAVNLMLSWGGILGPIAPPEIVNLSRALDRVAPNALVWQRQIMLDVMFYGERMPDQAYRVYLNARSR